MFWIHLGAIGEMHEVAWALLIYTLEVLIHSSLGKTSSSTNPSNNHLNKLQPWNYSWKGSPLIFCVLDELVGEVK